MQEEYLLLGYISDAFSLDGTFKVLSKTDFADKRYQKGKEIFLYQPNTKQRMTVVVESYRKGGQFDFVKVQGINSKEEALEFKGYEIQALKDYQIVDKDTYYDENKKTVYAFLEKELPDVYALPQDATYLMWLDISRYTDESGELQQFLRKKAGLFVMPGRDYVGNGNLFLRLNTACPRSLLEDGLNRLKAGLDLWRNRA